MLIPHNNLAVALWCALALSNFKVSAEPVIDICPDDASKSTVHKKLKRLLSLSQSLLNGGYGFHLWASVVNRDGKVCAVVGSVARTYYDGKDWS